MDYDFTLNGQRFCATREQVIANLRGLEPGRFRRHGVEVEGVLYPITQAFAVAFGLQRGTFGPNLARRVFQRLAFTVAGPGPQPRNRPRLRTNAKTPAEPGEEQELSIGPIRLQWCAWQRWEDLEVDRRRDGGVIVPAFQPGVYEVAREDEPMRLVIGRARNLCQRVKHGLVRGTMTHMGGRLIEAHEDLSRVRIRWALTDRPAAAEEELHQLHLREFGVLPRYTWRT